MSHKVTVQELQQEIISVVLAKSGGLGHNKQLRMETVVGRWAEYVTSSYSGGVAYSGNSLEEAVKVYNELD